MYDIIYIYAKTNIKIMKHIYVNKYASFIDKMTSNDVILNYQEVKLLPSAPFAGSGSPLSIVPPPIA